MYRCLWLVAFVLSMLASVARAEEPSAHTYVLLRPSWLPVPLDDGEIDRVREAAHARLTELGMALAPLEVSRAIEARWASGRAKEFVFVSGTVPRDLGPDHADLTPLTLEADCRLLPECQVGVLGAPAYFASYLIGARAELDPEAWVQAARKLKSEPERRNGFDVLLMGASDAPKRRVFRPELWSVIGKKPQAERERLLAPLEQALEGCDVEGTFMVRVAGGVRTVHTSEERRGAEPSCLARALSALPLGDGPLALIGRVNLFVLETPRSPAQVRDGKPRD